MWICIFQTLNPFFWYLGVFFTNIDFTKNNHFCDGICFDTNHVCEKHPQEVFWIYFTLFKYLFSIFVFSWVIGELRELCAKFWNSMIKIHGEIICQSWPLLTLFYSDPIVHWCISGHFGWSVPPYISSALHPTRLSSADHEIHIGKHKLFEFTFGVYMHWIKNLTRFKVKVKGFQIYIYIQWYIQWITTVRSWVGEQQDVLNEYYYKSLKS